MAKFSLEKVKQELEEIGLEYVNGEYLNLKSILTVRCHEGHEFLTSLAQARKGAPCPICFQYDNQDVLESKLETPPVKQGRRILAIDNATKKTGFAIFENGEYISGGVKTSAGNDSASKIAEMKQWLISMILLWEIDEVGLENVYYSNNNPQILITLSKLLGVLENAVYELLHKPPVIVAAVTWKSHSGVKGKNRDQQKENAQKVVKARYGLAVSSDLADAILLGRYVCHETRFGEEIKWGK